jgi:hypothetical protein
MRRGPGGLFVARSPGADRRPFWRVGGGGRHEEICASGPYGAGERCASVLYGRGAILENETGVQLKVELERVRRRHQPVTCRAAPCRVSMGRGARAPVCAPRAVWRLRKCRARPAAARRRAESGYTLRALSSTDGGGRSPSDGGGT